MKSILISWLLICTVCTYPFAQSQLTQTIKGIIIDADSKKPIAGATIELMNTSQKSISDLNGSFKLENITIGRQSIMVLMVGYTSKVIPEIMVSSGKEVFVTIPITENINELKEVTVTSRKNRVKAINEFATASARQFSVEETKRYPAAVYDPARMAMNFAGVSSNGDGNNEIVIRGNSPKGLLWRLEGIEIPNPNHFGAQGSSGGGISMLSSSTLGNSDFYTGAFPAEIGNALSGSFDLQFREGNKDKTEYAFMLGALGIEAAAEGPFKKGGKSSYLVNYRYSTLALLSSFLDMNGIVPAYQDLSFKLNFVTKKAGNFSIFGLGGYNSFGNDPDKDSTKWDDDNTNLKVRGSGKTGVLGISHQYFLNKHSYLKTIIAVSGNSYNEKADSLNPSQQYRADQIGATRNRDAAIRLSMLYNNKINSRNTFRSGFILSHLGYNFNQRFYDDGDNIWKEYMKGDGRSQYYQAYVQWKHKVNNQLAFTSGIHASLLALNQTNSIEPRAAITYNPGNNQTLTLAVGVHARPENLAVYQFKPFANNTGLELPNRNLAIPKATHFVLGYEKVFRSGWRTKAELYYQHLYDIPVEGKKNSHFSILNTSNIYELFDVEPLVSAGKGKNYGIDVTIEKPFTKNYYILFTGSLYASKYTNFSGQEYNTRFNRNYQTNFIAGKEWKKGKNKKNILGLNGKIIASGGLRNSPIDLLASRIARKVQYVAGQYYTVSGPVYYRGDIGISYKINKRNSTHTISLDIQNVTNRENLFLEWYDNDTEKIKREYQMGLLPVINYRIEF